MPGADLHSASIAGPPFQPVAGRRTPVFVWESDEYAVFYAPRLACVLPRRYAAGMQSWIRRLPAEGSGQGAPSAAPPHALPQRAAARLVAAANQARAEADRWGLADFSPECLTLFPNNACNLACRYCHSAPEARSGPSIGDAALRSAGALVAAACAQRGIPFTAAFHGGGEPALDSRRVDHILALLGIESRKQGATLKTYIATNGAMPEDRARWLANRFDLVGLSCDGPPDVQNRQRPARNGAPTAVAVARTARILRQAGKRFHLRATVTAETIARQAEIAVNFSERHAPAEIRLEPVYRNPASADALGVQDAAPFVAGFMEARRAAAARGIPVATSLAQFGRLQGRHCNMLRHVLNLVPGDLASGCFLESRAEGIAQRGVRMGAFDPSSGRFELDNAGIAALAARCAAIPAGCETCLCCYQCTHGCPDVCALAVTSEPTGPAQLAGEFRCQATRLLAEAVVRETAAAAWRNTPTATDRDYAATETTPLVAVYRNANAGSPSP